jgi:hypothetical protein
MKAIWDILASAGADVILTGHDHSYERFGPQTSAGQANPNGIREFVVGTGGASHYLFRSIQPNSEMRNSDTYGVLKLTLHATSYDWEFVPVAGGTFSDKGSASCVSAVAPADLTSTQPGQPETDAALPAAPGTDAEPAPDGAADDDEVGAPGTDAEPAPDGAADGDQPEAAETPTASSAPDSQPTPAAEQAGAPVSEWLASARTSAFVCDLPGDPAVAYVDQRPVME